MQMSLGDCAFHKLSDMNLILKMDHIIFANTSLYFLPIIYQFLWSTRCVCQERGFWTGGRLNNKSTILDSFIIHITTPWLYGIRLVFSNLERIANLMNILSCIWQNIAKKPSLPKSIPLSFTVTLSVSAWWCLKGWNHPTSKGWVRCIEWGGNWKSTIL